jgi:transcriptional regulator with XRE-family HTH domain
MFKDILKQLRKRENMTQSDLAEALKISRSTIAMYETDIRNPDHETMKRLSEIFNVSMDYLYEKEKPAEDDGLSPNRRKLIDSVRAVPEDKVEQVYSVIQSILEALK